jgi:N-acetylmuramoyl-L-alanine amidase
MVIGSRSLTAALLAAIGFFVFSSPAHPSANAEAGRTYSVASKRFSALKKSSKQKYRSYWVDCARTFESIEKKYPATPSAAESCYDRGSVFQGLYHWSRLNQDLDEAVKVFQSCQAAYPSNVRAVTSLYYVFDTALTTKRDMVLANDVYSKLSSSYPNSTWTKKAKKRLTRLQPRTMARKRKPETEIREMPVPIIAAPGKSSPPGSVSNIRYWSGGAYTRIVIEQSTEVKFLPKELKHPDRLVFDLLNTRLSPSVDKDPLPVNDGILKQVRASQFGPETVRVVLDLASLKSYAAFPLHEPERLVIDVTGEGAKPAETAEPAADKHPAAPQESLAKTNIPALPEVKNNDGDKLSLSRQLGLKIRTIAIDAGHGGYDPGAIGKSGLKEKTVTLDVAKRLAALVKDQLGCNVIMTRDSDVFIPLEERPFIAKSKGADLFVSIHVNATRKRSTRGIETYVQSLRASDREAMATAARENATSTKKLSELKSELDRIFADLTRDDKIEESYYLADSVQQALVANLKSVNQHAGDLKLKGKFKRAFFYVLIKTDMPSILAEIGFISNPEEEKLLKTDAYRQSIAEALLQGVKRYMAARDQQVAGL